jgi:uncharacterized protein YjbJ (UPF0337 family)
MDENRVAGAAHNVAGKAQETLGSAMGDMETEGKGRAKQAMGQAQHLYGNALDTARSYTDEQPLTALLIAGGIGLAIGMLLGRR